MTGHSPAIEVRHLRKLFGEVVAVRDVFFQVRYGEVYGLLGPNGAGKTTTFSMIAGILEPTSGEILIDGMSLREHARELKKKLGIVPQDITLFERLTPYENLLYFASLYDVPAREAKERAYELLDWMELLEKSTTPVKNLSGGMKRRVNFVCGLIHRPSILLLDEPTVGIDVHTRLMILEKTMDLAREGMAILYTTHYMEEAEKICTRVGILDHGLLLMEGTLEELHEKIHSQVTLTLTGEFQPDEMETFFEKYPQRVQVLLKQAGRIVLGVEESEQALELLSSLRERFIIRDVRLQPPSLESLFIELTGRELRE